MAPRRRLRKNADLPANLYEGKGGFFYRHPKTHKNHGMGSDRREAIKAAKILNERLVDSSSLVTRILGGALVSEVTKRYREEHLVDKDLSTSYISQVIEKLNRIDRELGQLAWDSLDLKTLSDWMKLLTRNSYVKYRSLWVDLFAFACAVGLSPSNTADLLLIKKPGKKKRKRWSLETYLAVYKHAEPWLQVAMDFAVTSLQRRVDLVKVHKKRDFQEGRILVMQQKTKKMLAIKIGDGLAQVIARAKHLHPFCPFVIGKKPERARKSPKNPKEHPYQLTTDYLTKAVAEVRDTSGVFEGWDSEETPTLHELRSLGAHLYEEAGYPQEYIQVLLGHADAKMTELYLEGYGEKWEEVAADLPLNFHKP